MSESAVNILIHSTLWMDGHKRNSQIISIVSSLVHDSVSRLLAHIHWQQKYGGIRVISTDLAILWVNTVL